MAFTFAFAFTFALYTNGISALGVSIASSFDYRKLMLIGEGDALTHRNLFKCR